MFINPIADDSVSKALFRAADEARRFASGGKRGQ